MFGYTLYKSQAFICRVLIVNSVWSNKKAQHIYTINITHCIHSVLKDNIQVLL